jgi:DNA processing protein
MVALSQLTGDHTLVHRIASSTIGTWEQLSQFSPPERARYLGPAGASLRVPSECPPLDYPGLGVELVTRYEAAYPKRLLSLSDPPAVVRLRGHLPPSRTIYLIGPHWPSPEALSWAERTTRAAGHAGWAVAVVLESGIARRVMETALADRVPLVVVTASNPADLLEREHLVAASLAGPGSVLSEWHTNARPAHQRSARASHLAATLSEVTVVVEAGPHEQGGAHFVRAALTSASRLAVRALPTPVTLVPFERAAGALLGDPQSLGLWAPTALPATLLNTEQDLAGLLA